MPAANHEENGDAEARPGSTLNASESTDSDEMHNADGDETVEPAQKWSIHEEEIPEMRSSSPARYLRAVTRMVCNDGSAGSGSVIPASAPERR